MPHSLDPATITSAKVAELFAYWQKRRGDRKMPRRTDIDPTGIKGLLPNLFLTEFSTNPFRVRYRLIGTEIAEHARFDFTGRYLDELDFSEFDKVDWQGLYRMVWAQGVPVFGDALETFRDKLRPPSPYHFCILPLSNDGLVATGAVALEEYQKLSLREVEQLPTVGLKTGGS